ncbi:MAG: hypothetical protein M3Y54_22215 [Bacteroidota bacterium]|nr:hypothetical protein [Bacteroidota bacterium]
MEISLITALISTGSAVLVAGLTYYLSKRREQEIEWRKLKLEHYRAYLAALSGVVSSRSTPDNQLKYADAANNIQLVAPEIVLTALYKFQDVIKLSNNAVSIGAHDKALTELLHAMRADVHPNLTRKHGLQFQLFDIPATVQHT